MSINQAALKKVRAAKMNGGSFAMVLEDIGRMLDLTGAAETSMTFDYQHDDVTVESGDLIPCITLGLRQATIKQLSADEAQEKSDPGEADVAKEASAH